MDDQHVAMLRDRGVQPTAQRLAVLRAVADRSHSTADDVARLVRERIGTISHQGVYDALAILVEKGVLRRIEPAGSPARFETRVGDNHHHLICRACGKTEDVDCATASAPCLSPRDLRGFAVDEAEVIFWGTCPACLSKAVQPGHVSPAASSS